MANPEGPRFKSPDAHIEQEAFETAIEAARSASDLVLKYWPNPANEKFDRDLVMHIFNKQEGVGNFATIADTESERLITGIIRGKALLADHAIMGEELGATGESQKWQWVIDPIDGTLPFSNGLPEFSISIGVMKNGFPHIGVIALPAFHQIITARRGAGAYLHTIDGTRMADLKDLRPQNINIRRLLVGYDTGYEKRREQLTRTISKISDHVGNTVSYSSAAYGNFMVALGTLGGYLHSGLTKYDIAAAAAILEETGCVASTIEGNPIDWSAERSSYLAARSPEIHAQLLELLRELG